MRLSGHYLPLGTIAWGLGLYYLFGNLDVLRSSTASPASPPSISSASSCKVAATSTS
jgi:branched-chain amino acid transport system permease protein